MEEFDVEDSDFFNTLTRDYPQLFRSATDQVLPCVICLPPNGSLPLDRPSLEIFLRSHILQPSREFLGRWTCLGDKARQVEEEDRCLVTKDWGARSRKVRILHEETMFSNEGKPYKVMFIQNSLLHVQGAWKQQCTHQWPRTLTQLMDVLIQHSKKEHRFNLDTAMQQFSQSYVCIDGFEHLIAEKLNGIYHNTVQEIFNSTQALYDSQNKRVAMNVQLAVHSYLLSGVNEKLFGHFRRINAHRDAQLRRYYALFRSRDLASFGVPPHLVSPQLKAISHVSQLSDKTNAFEKMQILNEVLAAITQDVATVRSSAADLTADGLIPILIYVLVQGGPPEMSAQMHYLDVMAPDILAHSELGYARVSFEAAVKYILEEGARQFGEEPLEDPVAAVGNVGVTRTSQPRRTQLFARSSSDALDDAETDEGKRSPRSSPGEVGKPRAAVVPAATPRSEVGAQMLQPAPKVIAVNDAVQKPLGGFLGSLMKKNSS